MVWLLVFFVRLSWLTCTIQSKTALNQDKLTEKFKIMALSSLAAQNLNMSLPYSAIAKAIDVPVSEVEQWIIHGKILFLHDRS